MQRLHEFARRERFGMGLGRLAGRLVPGWGGVLKADRMAGRTP